MSHKAFTQGTFTPGVSFGGSSTGITYSVQSGTYTQVGNVVFVNIRFDLSSKGAQTGNARLTGLPVTAVSADTYCLNVDLAGGLTIASTIDTVAAFTDGATTTATFYYSNFNGGSTTAVTNAHFSNSTQILINGFYIVA